MKKKINIILVSQVFSEHSICFAIQPAEVDLAESLLKEEFWFEMKNHFAAIHYTAYIYGIIVLD